MELRQALSISQRVIKHLAPHCERIALAGSVRRMKPEVKDIELVCIPRISPVLNLFGERQYDHAPIEIACLKLGKIVKAGEKYKQIALNDGINLDLFSVVSPAQWGVILAIRTGPADFSRWIVTQRDRGGALPSHAYVSQGAVWIGGQRIYDETGENSYWTGGRPTEMPEEKDFFDFLDLGWVEPKYRKSGWGKWKNN